MSGKSPFAEPTAQDFASAKKRKLPMTRYFPPYNPSYQPAVGYIQRHAPRIVAHTHAYNQTLGTAGYFCQAHFKDFKLVLWQAFPVVLDGMVMYSTGAAGASLFSRHDVYPLKACTFEGQQFQCPQRTHRYLV